MGIQGRCIEWVTTIERERVEEDEKKSEIILKGNN